MPVTNINSDHNNTAISFMPFCLVFQFSRFPNVYFIVDLTGRMKLPKMSAMGQVMAHTAGLSKKDREAKRRQIDKASSAAFDYMKIKMSDEPEDRQMRKYFGSPDGGVAALLGGGNLEKR